MYIYNMSAHTFSTEPLLGSRVPNTRFRSVAHATTGRGGLPASSANERTLTAAAT